MILTKMMLIAFLLFSPSAWSDAESLGFFAETSCVGNSTFYLPSDLSKQPARTPPVSSTEGDSSGSIPQGDLDLIGTAVGRTTGGGSGFLPEMPPEVGESMWRPLYDLVINFDQGSGWRSVLTLFPFGNWFIENSSSRVRLFASYDNTWLSVRSLTPGTGSRTVTGGTAPYDVFEHLIEWDYSQHGQLGPITVDPGQYARGTSEQIEAAGNAYYYSALARRYIRDVLPQWEPPAGLIAEVNPPLDLPCGAWYNPSSNTMAFTQARYRNCGANASYSSVNVHEFGHAFVMTLGLDPATANDYFAFHEGVADALSALVLDLPCMGRGWGTGMLKQCYRDISVPAFFSRNINTPSDPHLRGLPIAGAFYELQQELKGIYAYEEPLQLGLGRKITQYLFIESIRRNNTGFDDSILSNLLAANRDAYQLLKPNWVRLNQDAICRIFQSRGFRNNLCIQH